jgi:hypothetical protein
MAPSTRCPVTCCIAAVAAAVFGDEAARDPAEWLQIARRETQDQKRTESPRRRLLLEGAAVALHPYDGRPGMLAKRVGKDPRYTAFHDWRRTQGEALFARWRRGGKLTAAEREHYFLLNGMCFARHKHEVRPKVRSKADLTPEEQDIHRYVERVDRRGVEVLQKGYLGRKLTAAEIEDLRLYAMLVDNRCTGGRVLPFHIGLCGPSGGRRPPAPGEPAPDFMLLRFEAALDGPDYSDLNPYDPTDILRPAILSEYLLLMQGYERDPNSERPTVRAKPIVVVPEGRRADYVRLADFRGTKAVLFVLANATDAFAWHWKISPMFEPLYRAYKDRIALFFVHTTIHDTYMPVKDFLGPDPGRHSAVHDLTMAHRARCCKMFYMDRPHVTVPYLLDDMAQRTRNAYRDQGGGAYIVLVDLDGRVAYADYHQDIPPHWGPKAVSFHDEYVYIRMNHLESRLKSFVENGCRYGRKIETTYPAWRRRPTVEKAAVGGAYAAIWLSGRITAVDAAGRVLTVERHRPDAAAMKGWGFWQAAGGKAAPYDPETKARLDVVARWVKSGNAGRTYRFVIDDAVDLFLHGHAATLADLRVGDHVGVLYPTSQEGRPTVHPQQVRAQRVPPAPKKGA